MSETSATGIAAAVAAGRITARAVVEASLARIAAVDPKINAFTDILAARARATADSIDEKRARGKNIGPLAGVPFAVKNLFDVAGLPTRAGSKINRDRLPAPRDAALVRRLEDAGAVLVGALNMGEYAYDFSGVNLHDGPSRNPHAPDHLSGGSSGGSAAAVAAGMVPLSLGSDTNGSIRVPASFCGVFGLKPTFGRLSRAGTFPFVASFDHVGPFARNVSDLALAYDAMQGPDRDDPVATLRAAEPASPQLEAGVAGLRIGVLGGYFGQNLAEDSAASVARVAAALGAKEIVELPEVARARAAAFVITSAEGGALHLDRLRMRSGDFDPSTRDRLIAGAVTPAVWVHRAQRFRYWFKREVARIFQSYDVLLAPGVPDRAPKIGQAMFTFGGKSIPVSASLGIFTQPISFVGLPVVLAPVWLDEGLPLGVQIIAPPWHEARALRVARTLEIAGVVAAPIAKAIGATVQERRPVLPDH